MGSIARWAAHGVRRRLERLPQVAVDAGLPARWLGWRWVPEETVTEFVRRCRPSTAAYETVHPRAVVSNPLPENVGGLDELPDDRGWWGYSFRDVPTRISGETFIARLPDCRLVTFVDEHKGRFHPAMLTSDDRSLTLREVKFRAGHGRLMRAGRPPVRLDRATWILERVFDNHSHWLTAHLPKLCLLEERKMLGDVILPRSRTPVIDASLELLGLDPERFRTFDPARPLEIGELTVLGTDRFRPELLRKVRAAIAPSEGATPHRRVFISRARAARRKLLDEDALWPRLRAAGFERVHMEDASFADQVRLMRETKVLMAPHGAGLTNMMFCSPSTHVVEIADLCFPNPNFYALACAMGHRYWLVRAEGAGGAHPLEKDLRVSPARIDEVLERLPS